MPRVSDKASPFQKIVLPGKTNPIRYGNHECHWTIIIYYRPKVAGELVGLLNFHQKTHHTSL